MQRNCFTSYRKVETEKEHKPIRHNAIDESEEMLSSELNVTIIYIFETVKVCGNYNK